MTNKIQIRRGTASAAASNNVILAAGEPGWDSTNGILKIGDGTTHWNDLPAVMSGVYVAEAEKGTASGVATLDAGTKLLVGQIPPNGMAHKFFLCPTRGSDSNDGLSIFSPKATLGSIAAALPTTGAAEIVCEAGTTSETGSVTFDIPVNITGLGHGPDSAHYGTVFQFPSGSSGVVFGANATGSRLQRLVLQSLSPTLTLGTGDGLRCASRIRLEQVTIRDFARYNINADSSGGLNMNWMQWHHVRLSGSGSDAVYINCDSGANSNAGLALGVDITSAGGWDWNIAGTAVYGWLIIGGQVGNGTPIIGKPGTIRDCGNFNEWRNIDVEPITVHVAAGSNGLTLPQATIAIDNASVIEGSGIALVTSDVGKQPVYFTGVAAGNLTGCSGGVGILSTGGAVEVEPLVDFSASTNAVWWHPRYSNSFCTTPKTSSTTTVFNGNAWQRLRLIGPQGPGSDHTWEWNVGVFAPKSLALMDGGGTIFLLDVDSGNARARWRIPHGVYAHMETGSVGSAPTAAAVGTNATSIARSTNVNDTAGILTFTTAAGLAADSGVVKLTFGTAYRGTNPLVVHLTPTGSTAAIIGAGSASLAGVLVNGQTDFTIVLHSPPPGATTMSFAYFVSQ